MPLSVIRSIVTRKYTDFRGIDLLNAETNVDYRRSPDCLNVWKSYRKEQSNIIETRPGIKLIRDISDNSTNNKIYSMYMWDSDTVIVHKGNKLLKWDGFPNSETPTITTGIAVERIPRAIPSIIIDALPVSDEAESFLVAVCNR